jgi:hypothetical protein
MLELELEEVAWIAVTTIDIRWIRSLPSALFRPSLLPGLFFAPLAIPAAAWVAVRFWTKLKDEVLLVFDSPLRTHLQDKQTAGADLGNFTARLSLDKRFGGAMGN